MSGSLTDLGINDDTIREMSEGLPPGGSAPFVLVRRVTRDTVLDRPTAFRDKGKVVDTSLSAEQEQAPRVLFGRSRGRLSRDEDADECRARSALLADQDRFRGRVRDLMARIVSPYTLGGRNPLRDLLHFEAIAADPVKRYITATNVRNGRGRVYRRHDITPDMLLASACLPTLHQAVEIDGEGKGRYWADMRMHRITNDLMVKLGAFFKLNAQWAGCATRADAPWRP